MHDFITPNRPRLESITTIVTPTTAPSRRVSHCTIVSVHCSCIVH